MTVMGTNLELYCTALENVGSVVPEWILWWWCVTCDIFPLDLSVRPHLQLVGWGRSRSLGNTIKFQVKFQVDFSWFRVISNWFQDKSVISFISSLLLVVALPSLMMIQQNTPSNSLISVIQKKSHSFIGGIANIIFSKNDIMYKFDQIKLPVLFQGF